MSAIALALHGGCGTLPKEALPPEQWAEAIGRLTHDPDLRRQLGRAGRQRVEEEFSLAKGARRWLDVLRKVERSQQLALR